MSILSLTSTQSNAQTIAANGFPGEVIACEDVLYEGPLELGLGPEQLAKKRADYFSACGMDGAKALSASYAQRFRQLAQFRKYEQMILWFSQNLYNQLLLIQLLHWIEGQDTGRIEIALATPDRLPVSHHIQSFDVLSNDQLNSLFNHRIEVSIKQLEVAKAVWERVCDEDPRDLVYFSRADMASLPFLTDAIRRFIQQFPSKSNGLSRSEKGILEILTTGESEPSQVYLRVQRKEDFPFMNQMMFWLTASRLIKAENPAIALEDRARIERPEPGVKREIVETHMVLTDVGRKLLKNGCDWIDLNGIDRWVGGVHIASGNIWRWDGAKGTIVRTYV